MVPNYFNLALLRPYAPFAADYDPLPQGILNYWRAMYPLDYFCQAYKFWFHQLWSSQYKNTSRIEYSGVQYSYLIPATNARFDLMIDDTVLPPRLLYFHCVEYTECKIPLNCPLLNFGSIPAGVDLENLREISSMSGVRGHLLDFPPRNQPQDPANARDGQAEVEDRRLDVVEEEE